MFGRARTWHSPGHEAVVTPDPKLIIEAIYAARRANDQDAMKRLQRDDIVFTFNADPDRPGSGERLVGSEAIFEHFGRVDAHWQLLEHVIGPLLGDGMVYNRSIRIKMRHRATGQLLDGTKRHVITVLDDKIAAITEHLDHELIQAILRFEDPGQRPAA